MPEKQRFPQSTSTNLTLEEVLLDGHLPTSEFEAPDETPEQIRQAFVDQVRGP